MRALLASLLLAAAGTTYDSCDPTRFKQPLSDPAQAKPDPKLLGTWAGYVGDNPTTVQIVPAKGGAMDVVLVSQSEDGATELLYQGFPTAAGAKAYLNLREKRPTDALKDQFEVSSDSFVAAYRVEKSGALQIDLLLNEGVAAAVKAGALHADVGSQVTLTDAPAVVLAFLAKPDTFHVFKPFGTFHRVKIDFGKPPRAKAP